MAAPLASPESEAALLGALMLDNSAWERVAASLSAEAFSRREHSLIFEAIATRAAAGKSFDAVTVSEWLERRNELTAAGGLSYLGGLVKDTPSAANIDAYAELVRERHRARRAVEALTAASKQLLEGSEASEVLAEVQGELESLSHAPGTDLAFPELLQCGMAAIAEAEERARTGGSVGIRTGLPEVDRKTGGLRGPRLWCIAGRPSLGKTALANQIALSAAHRGFKVGICSLEMSEEELALRALAYKLQLNMAAMSQADSRTLSLMKERLPGTQLGNYGIWTDTQTFALDGIVSRITAWRRRHGIDFAVVDHIGLVEVRARASSNRNEELGLVSRTLKKLCKRLAIPIVAVSQLNREVEKLGRRPRLSDLRDSGNVEQDIDVGLFIHSDQDGGSEIPVEFGLLKNRMGRRGWLEAEFIFDGRVQTFRECHPAERRSKAG